MKRAWASLWRGGRRRQRERPRALAGDFAASAAPARPARDPVLNAGRRGARARLRPQSAQAYAEIVEGSLSLDSLPDTLNWATPLVGMTLVAAIPLRGGMLNLGGDGQLVIGGLIGALLPLVLPGPGALVSIAALAAAAFGAGLYATLAAWGEARHGIPMLISSLLLSYPAVGVTSYLARFPFRDGATGLPQTAMVPTEARLHALSGALSAGSLAHSGDRGRRRLRRSAHRRRLRTAHAGEEPAFRRIRRRPPRAAGDRDDVHERRDRLASSAQLWCSARSFALSTARC